MQKIYITGLSKVDEDPTTGFNRSQYGFHCPESATRTVAGPRAGPFYTHCDLKSEKSCVGKCWENIQTMEKNLPDAFHNEKLLICSISSPG